MTTATATGPRVYVACLASYNDGILYGEWIDAAQTPEELREEIARILKGSPAPMAEEWAFHDFEGFGEYKVSEYESLDTLSAVALGIEEHGDAFAAYLANGSDADNFEEAYMGEYSSLQDYAEQYVEETGMLDNVNDTVKQYFNFEAFARDLRLGGDVWTADAPGGVWVFNGNV